MLFLIKILLTYEITEAEKAPEISRDPFHLNQHKFIILLITTKINIGRKQNFFFKYLSMLARECVAR